MGAETKIIVRVLRTHEETIEVYAVTRLEAEAEERRMDGVVAVLESGYPEDMPNTQVDNKIAALSEHCRALEQRLECVRGELMRVRDLVGELDTKLIDEVLEHTANAAGQTPAERKDG